MASLDLLRLLVGASFLFYASLLDLRTRRVPNKVWLSFGVFAVLLFLADWLVVGRLDWTHLVIAVAVVLLAYVLWYVHLLAGGADAKALMVLGILLPMGIRWDWGGVGMPAWSSPLPGALTVLSNSVLLFALAPLVLLVLNLVRGHVSMPAMLLGYRMNIDAAAESFVWIIDRIDEEGRRHKVLFPSRTSDEAYAANLQRLRAAGQTKVWVTPKIPFMVPLFIGFTTAFIVGDILYRTVEALVFAAR